jgi:type VI secretion system protein ImpK
MSTDLSLMELTGKFHPLEQGYFRSKIYTTPLTINPFLTAASPIFSLLERFTATQTLPAIQAIKHHIDHEWKAFRSRLSSLKSTPTFLTVAEYFVSATLDEVIGKTYLRIQGSPAEFIAYTPSTDKEHGPEKRFFDLIVFMQKQPHEYLDLLELAYYCLICGFEGEYHTRADGRHALDNLIHSLYEIVTQYRAHKPIRLFKENHSPIPTEHEKLHPYFWKSIVVGFAIVAALFISVQVIISEKANHIFMERTQQTQMESHG